MRTLNTLLSLTPAPVFLLGGIVSAITTHHGWEMPLMWFVMAFAHTAPWVMWYQQRQYQKVKVFPEKQQ